MFERGQSLRAAAHIWLAFARPISHDLSCENPDKVPSQDQLNHTSPLDGLHGCGSSEHFAAAGSAEAEIHYSGNVLIRLTGNAQASLPLSNGASLVFKNIFETTYVQHFRFIMKGVTSGSARAYRQDSSVHRNWISNLPSRENVSAGKFLSVAGHPYWGMLFTYWSNGAFFPPHFAERLRGFVGFRFNTGNGTQYGWVRIQTSNDINDHAHDVIKDYAWGDPGDVILTGQTALSSTGQCKLGSRFPRPAGFWSTRLGRVAHATHTESN